MCDPERTPLATYLRLLFVRVQESGTGEEFDHLTHDAYGTVTPQTQPTKGPRFGFQAMAIDQAADAAAAQKVGTATRLYYD